MKRILFLGCSNTYGSELVNPKKERYSKLLCNMLNCEEVNIAIPGNATLNTVFQLYEYLETNLPDFIFYQIPSPTRFTIPYQNKITSFRTSNKYNLFDIDSNIRKRITNILFKTSDRLTWHQYTLLQIKISNQLINNKKIPVLYFCCEDDSLDYYTNNSNLPFVNWSLNGWRRKTGTYIRGRHANKDDQIEIANLLYPEVKNTIKL